MLTTPIVGLSLSDPAVVVESAGANPHIDLNQLVEAAESGSGYVHFVDGKPCGLGNRLLLLG